MSFESSKFESLKVSNSVRQVDMDRSYSSTDDVRRLKDIIENQNQDMDRYRQYSKEYQQMKEKNIVLQSDLDGAQVELAKLRSQLVGKYDSEQLRRQVDDLNHNVIALETGNSYRKLFSENSKLRAQIDSFRARSSTGGDNSERRIAELQSKIIEMESDMFILIEDHNENKIRLEHAYQLRQSESNSQYIEEIAYLKSRVAELETAVEKNNSSSKRDNSDWRRRYLEVEGRLREYDDLKEQHLKLKDELKQAKKVQLQQHEQRRIVRDLENQISTLKFTPIAMLEDQNRQLKQESYKEDLSAGYLSQIDQLKILLGQAEQRLILLTESNETLQQEVTRSKENTQINESRITINLKRQATEWQEKYQILENQYRELQDEYSEISRQVQQSQRDLRVAQTKEQELLQQNKQLSNKLAQQIQTNTQISEELMSTEERYSSQIQGLNQKLLQVNQDSYRMDSVTNEFRGKEESYKVQINELRSKEEQYKLQLSEFRSTEESYQVQISQLQQQITLTIDRSAEEFSQKELKYQQQIQSLSSQFANVNDQMVALRDTIQRSFSSTSEWQVQQTTMTNKIQSLETMIASLQRKDLEWQQLYQVLEQTYKKQEDQNHLKNEQLQTQQQEINMLLVQVKEAQEWKLKFQRIESQQSSESETVLRRNESQRESFMLEKETIMFKLRQSEEQVVNLQLTIEQLQSDTLLWKTKQQQLEREYQSRSQDLSLQSQVVSLRDERDILISKVGVMETQLQQYRDRVSLYETNLTLVQKESLQLRLTLESKDSEQRQQMELVLRKQREEFETALQLKSQEVADFERRFNAKTIEVQQLSVSFANDSQRRELEQRVQTFQRQNQELETVVQLKNQQQQDLYLQMQTIRSDSESQRSEYDSLRKQFESVRTENVRLIKQVEVSDSTRSHEFLIKEQRFQHIIGDLEQQVKQLQGSQQLLMQEINEKDQKLRMQQQLEYKLKEAEQENIRSYELMMANEQKYRVNSSNEQNSKQQINELQGQVSDLRALISRLQEESNSTATIKTQLTQLSQDAATWKNRYQMLQQQEATSREETNRMRDELTILKNQSQHELQSTTTNIKQLYETEMGRQKQQLDEMRQQYQEAMQWKFKFTELEKRYNDSTTQSKSDYEKELRRITMDYERKGSAESSFLKEQVQVLQADVQQYKSVLQKLEQTHLEREKDIQKLRRVNEEFSMRIEETSMFELQIKSLEMEVLYARNISSEQIQEVRHQMNLESQQESAKLQREYEQQLTAMESQYRKVKEALEGKDSEIQRLMMKLNERSSSVKIEIQEQILNIRRESESEMGKVKRSYESQIVSLQQQLEQQNKDFTQILEKRIEAKDVEIQRLMMKLNEQSSSVKIEIQEQILNVRRESELVVGKVKRSYESKLASLEQQLEQQNKDFTQILEKRIEAKDGEIQRLMMKLNEQSSSVKIEIQEQILTIRRESEAELSKVKRSYESQIASLQQQLEQQNMEFNKRLEKRLESQQMDIRKQMEIEVVRIRECNDKTQAQLLQSQNQVQEMKLEVKLWQERFKDLDEQAVTMQEQLDSRSEEVAMLTQSLQVKVDEAQQWKLRFQQQDTQSQDGLRKAVQQLQLYKNEIEVWQQRFSEVETHRDQIIIELQRVNEFTSSKQNESDQYKSHIAKLQTEHSTLKKISQQLEAKLSERELMLKRLQIEVEERDNYIQSQEEQNQVKYYQLEKDLKQKQKKMEQDLLEKMENQKQLEIRCQRLEQGGEENHKRKMANLEKQLNEHYMRQINQLEQTLIAERERMAELKLSIEDERKQMQQRLLKKDESGQVQRLKSRIGELEEHNNQKARFIEEMQAYIQSMELKVGDRTQYEIKINQIFKELEESKNVKIKELQSYIRQIESTPKVDTRQLDLIEKLEREVKHYKTQYEQLNQAYVETKKGFEKQVAALRQRSNVQEMYPVSNIVSENRQVVVTRTLIDGDSKRLVSYPLLEENDLPTFTKRFSPLKQKFMEFSSNEAEVIYSPVQSHEFDFKQR